MIECPNCHKMIPFTESTRSIWRTNEYTLQVTPDDKFRIIDRHLKILITYQEHLRMWIGIKNGKVIRISMRTFPDIIKEYEKL